MKDFDQRWQTLTREARGHSTESPVDLPQGFGSRVLALARQSSGEAWEDVLSLFGLRAMVAVTCVLVLSGSLAFSEWFEPRIEPPALEKSLTSHLSWP